MTQKLRDIIKIRSGIFAKSDTNPNLHYIQSTDFDKQHNWNHTLNPILTNSHKFSKHILKAGDVLFVAKGRDFFAVVYDGMFQPAVASTTFLVLEIQGNKITPNYLMWYLNHPQTQILIWSLAKGSSIPSITKTILEEIEIPVPELSKQTAILELHKLQIKEKQIHKKLGKLRQEYINELTYRSIK